MKQILIDSCSALGLEIINLDRIRSKKNYNNYQINYPKMYSSEGIKPFLLVEVTFLSKSFPSEIMQMSSIISEQLMEMDYSEEVYKYDMQPFYIRTQTLDRTLVDKTFAICDYYVRNEIERNSRHIYDIYKILPKITFDDTLKNLIYDVREDRRTGVTKTRSVTAASGVDIPSILQKIIDERFYESDYNKITAQMIYNPLTYDEAITGLQKIIDSGYFIEMESRIPMEEPAFYYKSPKEIAAEKFLNYKKVSMEGRGENTLNFTDREVFEKVKGCKKKERFLALYNGRSVYNDEFKDEIALIQHIAIYTDDVEQIKRIFKSSGQYREENENLFDKEYKFARKNIDKVIRTTKEKSSDKNLKNPPQAQPTTTNISSKPSNDGSSR